MPIPFHTIYPHIFLTNNMNFRHFNSMKHDIGHYYAYKNDLVYKDKTEYDAHYENGFTNDRYLITNQIDKYFELRDTTKIRFIPFVVLFILQYSRSISIELDLNDNNGLVYTDDNNNSQWRRIMNPEELLCDTDINNILKHFNNIYIKPFAIAQTIEYINKKINDINKKFTILYKDDPNYIKKSLICNNYMINNTLDTNRYLIYTMINRIQDYNNMNLCWFKHNVATDNYMNTLLRLYKPAEAELSIINSDLYKWHINGTKYYEKQYKFQKIAIQLLNILEKDYFVTCKNNNEVFNKLDNLYLKL